MKKADSFAPLLIGLTKEAANQTAMREGFITRVVMEDGFAYYVTDEWIPQRINLVLIENKVVEVSVG